MKRIIVAIVFIGLMISTTSLNICGIETIEDHEENLFNDLAQLLAFEGITARQILEKLPYIENLDEIILDTEENLRNELIQEINEIESSYETMASSAQSAPVGNGDIEYWGVLIGVDFTQDYICDPFELEAELMTDILPVSNHWKENHIITLTGEDVSLANVILSLLLLDLMEDENDVIFIFYSGHGYYLNYDLPPFDENDNKDEYITTYYTGTRPFSIITDDLLNYLLNRLESNKISVLIDSCSLANLLSTSIRFPSTSLLSFLICSSKSLPSPSSTIFLDIKLQLFIIFV